MSKEVNNYFRSARSDIINGGVRQEKELTFWSQTFVLIPTYLWPSVSCVEEPAFSGDVWLR